jgi:type I restriction enzyme M protein
MRRKLLRLSMGVSCAQRVKANLDIFWIRDESLEETANLPEPDVLVEEIVEDLGSALAQFRAILADLGER